MSPKTPTKTRDSRDARQGARRPASIAPAAIDPSRMAPGPCSPPRRSSAPSPTMARFDALGAKLGLQATASPDPLAVAAALLGHMPEVAEAIILTLEEEVEPFKSSGVTTTHLDGFIGLLESLCDELGAIAERRTKAAGGAEVAARETAPE